MQIPERKIFRKLKDTVTSGIRRDGRRLQFPLPFLRCSIAPNFPPNLFRFFPCRVRKEGMFVGWQVAEFERLGEQPRMDGLQGLPPQSNQGPAGHRLRRRQPRGTDLLPSSFLPIIRIHCIQRSLDEELGLHLFCPYGRRCSYRSLICNYSQRCGKTFKKIFMVFMWKESEDIIPRMTENDNSLIQLLEH